MLPNLIIIGAMKAGTTSLHHYLSQHPHVQMSTRKELHFFTTNSNRDLDWYKSFFQPNDNACIFGETSPSYSQAHRFFDTPKRIASLLGADIKLIYLVRQPIDRAVSHVMHSRAAGEINSSYTQALASNNFDNHFILTSQYGKQIAQFGHVFDINNILIVESRRLQDDTSTTMRHIFDFLGADPDLVPKKTFSIRLHESQEKHEYRSLVYQLSKRFTLGRPAQYKRHEFIKAALLRKLPTPEIDRALNDRLVRFFDDDISLLETISRRSFPSLRSDTRYASGNQDWV